MFENDDFTVESKGLLCIINFNFSSIMFCDILEILIKFNIFF